MAAEHLPISNYDEQSQTEVIQKLDILFAADPGGIDLEAVYEYEKANGKRPKVKAHINQLIKSRTE